MSSVTSQAEDASALSSARQHHRIQIATLVGTTIEWYDFLVYAQAAGLVFAQLFFGASGAGSTFAQLVAWASLGISFFFRPLGAVVAGHFGDRYGRKFLLVATLVMMGVATAGIGLLPTYSAIGVGAPILLILLRILQGFSAGGEWAGAAIMAVEHAPVNKRGLFGAFPNLGAPAGTILSAGIIWLMLSVTTPQQFLSWGWRIPFLLSIVLIFVGFLIRRSVGESPVFEELSRRKKETSAPLKQLFKHNTKNVLLVALIGLGSNAAGYMLITFMTSYVVRNVGLERSFALLVNTLVGVVWLAFTLWSGSLSDRIGRVRTIQLGYVLSIVWVVPLFLFTDTGNAWLFCMAALVYAVAKGVMYGPMSSFFSEMFPAHVRYSGLSIGFALGTLLGGAFAPMLAEWLFDTTGTSMAIAGYIGLLCLVSLFAVSRVREPKGRNLFEIATGE